MLGLLAFAGALALGSVASTAADQRLGLTGFGAKAVPAVVVFAVAVPAVLLLCRRVDRRPLPSIGVRRPGAALLGVGVVLAAAVLVFGLDALGGGLAVESVDAGTLLIFLATNTLLALLLEAVPEELVFRGYVFAALADRWRPWCAALVTTALFVVAPALSIVLAAGLGVVLGLPTDPPTFAPGGQDPLAYAILLAVFGVMLILARIATGSVWACVAAHLSFLTINRIVLPSSAFDTGVVVSAPPGTELLVLGYLVLALVAFAVLGRRRARS